MFLNFGSTVEWKREHPGWKVLNYSGPTLLHDGLDYQHNFNSFDRIQARNNLFDGIFCSGVFECIQGKYILHNLKEIYRLLKPNTPFRLIVPDIYKYIEQYYSDEKFTKDDFLYKTASYFADKDNIPNTFIKASLDDEELDVILEMSIDDICRFFSVEMQEYADTHQKNNPSLICSLFSYSELKQILSNAGFKNIYCTDVTKSDFDFFPTIDQGLCIEAIK